jgi:hypothetical protein
VHEELTGAGFARVERPNLPVKRGGFDFEPDESISQAGSVMNAPPSNNSL